MEGLPDLMSFEQRPKDSEEQAWTSSEGRDFLVEGTASVRAIGWMTWHVGVLARRLGTLSKGGMEGEEARKELSARVRTLDFDSKCDGKPVSKEDRMKITFYRVTGCWDRE